MQHAIRTVEMIGDLADLAADEAVADRTSTITVDLDDTTLIDRDRQTAQIGTVERARATSLLHRGRTLADQNAPLTPKVVVEPVPVCVFETTGVTESFGASMLRVRMPDTIRPVPRPASV